MKTWGIFWVVVASSFMWNYGLGQTDLHRIAESGSPQLCFPNGISTDGSTVVGRTREGSQWEAFRWNPNETIDPFLILKLKEGVTSTGGTAYDVSEDGNVIVGLASWKDTTTTYPTVWENEVLVEYDNSFGGICSAVSDDGELIVTHDTEQFFFTGLYTRTVAMRWNHTVTGVPQDYDPTNPLSGYEIGYIPMPVLPPAISYPLNSVGGNYGLNISGDGSVLVGYGSVSGARNAVRWYREKGNPFWTVESYDLEPEFGQSNVTGTSYDGRTIVGNDYVQVGLNESDRGYRAFKWTDDSREVVAWPETMHVPQELSQQAILDIESGPLLVIALLEDHKVYVWKSMGVWDEIFEPPETLINEKVVQVAAGARHLLALTEEGEVVAWGMNDVGQLDLPDFPGNPEVIDIAAGHFHSVALLEDGSVKVWGDNLEGQLILPDFGSPVIDIAAGRAHSIALTELNEIVGWGANDYGQCDPPTLYFNVVKIAAGFDQSIAVYNTGSPVGWGRNDYDQLDTWSLNDVFGVKDVALGERHTVLLNNIGEVEVLGEWESPQTQVPPDMGLAKAVVAGEGHSMALIKPDIQILEPLPGQSTAHDYTEAYGISGDGSVVVGRSGILSDNDHVAAYWDEEGVHMFTDKLSELGISDDGWIFKGITAVNYDGSSMAGYGDSAIGSSEAWHLAGPRPDLPTDTSPVEEFIDETEAEDVGDGYHRISWWGLIKRMEQSYHWHTEHGWQLIGKGKKEDLMIFDYGIGCWSWTSEKDYPYVYVYCHDSGWYWYKEDGEPGNREFWNVLQGKWISESEMNQN